LKFEIRETAKARATADSDALGLFSENVSWRFFFMRRAIIAVIVVLVVEAGLGFFLFSQIDLSALPEPGARESSLATSAKRWLIGRAARGSVGAAPASDASSADNGSMTYGMDCDTCHGKDGRHPTETGRWMYPRVPDLGSPGVQGWSDAELFWIIKNGVRFSGMPGFAKMQTDKEIWDLVHYVRSLGAPAPPSK
jgi:mono/diheme cytochrome c family protein